MTKMAQQNNLNAVSLGKIPTGKLDPPSQQHRGRYLEPGDVLKFLGQQKTLQNKAEIPIETRVIWVPGIYIYIYPPQKILYR